MTILFRLLEGRPIRALVAESWRLLAVSTAGNLLFGVVLAFLVATDHRMTIVGVALTLAVQMGSRGYVRIVDDRTRTQPSRTPRGPWSRSRVTRTASATCSSGWRRCSGAGVRSCCS